MEFKSGFDATPYMETASWGEPKYKSQSGDVEADGTSGKLSMGDGCKIHPSKSKRFKLQGESDPDNKVNTGLAKSTRAAVAVLRVKGSDYLPVIEDAAKVIPVTPEGLEEIPARPYKELAEDWDASNARLAKWEQEKNVIKARNDARKLEHFEYSRGGNVVSTETPSFAYKRFRLEASELVEHAKRAGESPGKFYNEHPFEIQAHALNACEASGVSFADLLEYVRAAGHDELARVIEDPGAYRDAIKANKPKARKPRATKKVKTLEEMSAEELSAEYTRRRDAYLEALEEMNRRLDNGNGRPEPEDPDPDPGESAPAPEPVEDKGEGDVTNPEEHAATMAATRAEKRAAMREAKARRKAQRRITRKMLRAGGGERVA